MKKFFIYLAAAAAALTATSCDKFLSEQIPQGSLSDEQVKDPKYVDNMVLSAYAIFTTAEDINGSFSMWNYDVRSDDAYKGGSSTNDGDVFHQLEVEKGVLTTNWNINDMWVRLYRAVARVNTALAVVEKCDEKVFVLKNERLAELRFLRAYGHFLLKRLYKNIPFLIRTDYSYEEYGTISNTEFTNDEGWQKIIEDLDFAYKYLPVYQMELGRPTKAASAAFLSKVYLYKAYRQDDKKSHRITEINTSDLDSLLKYSNPAIYETAGYGLEDDIHNNFRPEEIYENGVESIWAMQYSRNDGSTYGNLNWSNGLIPPNIAGVIDGGCDFYKPSQNLVNAFRTDADGLPMLDSFNDKDYEFGDKADPRLFLTVGMPGLPYMFNSNFMMDKSSNWSRSGGIYGYNVSLKQNVDPALSGSYLIKGSYWATSMNRIVFRYADVLLMRAEAYAQKGDSAEAIALVNRIRTRAKNSTQMIASYPGKYGVNFLINTYKGSSYNKETLLKIVKMERRLELAMEAERFFDLVRWGDAKDVLTKYFDEEKGKCGIYENAEFTADKCEYLPIPYEQLSASNKHYTQNIGNW